MGAMSGILFFLAVILLVAAIIGAWVCFIMVLIQMFKREETTIAILSIVGVFVCGFGPLLAFIYGWIKATEWNIKTIMLAWTGCFAGAIVGYAILFAASFMGASSMPANQFQRGMPPTFNMPKR